MPRRSVIAVIGAAVWVALLVAARVRGVDIAETPRVAVGAAPVVGRWVWRAHAGFVVPGVLGLAVVLWAPRWSDRLPWRTLLAVTVGLGVAWSVSLAATEGWSTVAEPLGTRYEYLAVIPDVDQVGVAEFVSTYADRLSAYPTHVKGHPPGPTLVFVALDRVGLAGPGWAAAVVIFVGASAAAAVLTSIRAVVDEATARRAMPFLVVMPGAIWVATSADAFFMGVIAWGVALTAVASVSAGRRQSVLGLVAGVVMALGLFMTYGAVPLLAVPATIVVTRRSWRVVPFAVVGALGLTLAFVVAGFWWFDGVGATRVLYESGVSQRRDAWYFLPLGNPAAFALVVGPAVAAALVLLRDRRVWAVVGAALAALVVADASGLSKGEVERIWLPFAPWLLASTVAFERPREVRVWLALQVIATLTVEAWLVSPW